MIINKYLRTQLGFHIFLVLAVTALIDLMTSILSEWSYGLQGNYQSVEAAWFVFVTLPGRLYELFPLVVLIGCLTGLGGLANTSELTIIRASGVSINGITFKIFVPVIFLLFLTGFVGEVLIPEADKYAQSFRAQLSKSETSTRYGVWHRELDDYIYISAARKDGHLEGIRILNVAKDGDPISQIFAKQAEYAGNGWLLQEVKLTKYQENGLQLTDLSDWLWETDLTPQQLQNLTMPPEKLSLFQLFQYVRYLNLQGINSDKYQLALWNKLLMPVMTLSLVLVAISFIFGPLREVATGTRVFIGVLVGLVLKMSQNILGPASLIFGFQPVFAALAPVIVSIILGLWLLSRVY